MVGYPRWRSSNGLIHGNNGRAPTVLRAYTHCNQAYNVSGYAVYAADAFRFTAFLPRAGECDGCVTAGPLTCLGCLAQEF